MIISLIICATVEPYWLRGKVPFWPLFLSKYKDFDHVHLIDIFKLICGDSGYRRIILQQSLLCEKILCNFYKPYSERLGFYLCLHCTRPYVCLSKSYWLSATVKQLQWGGVRAGMALMALIDLHHRRWETSKKLGSFPRLQRSAASSRSSIPRCWTSTVCMLIWFLFFYL